jgi:CubicO group peptidase (beta-lactamase class C family)
MTAFAFSPERLARMHDVLAGYVERGVAPGLVALVSRRGETYVDAIGMLAVDGDGPMARDTIFRIASMTKPITAAAAMILVEECVLRLDDPVDAYLPELADRQVLRQMDGPIEDTVPANRPITLCDLLTFRLGYGYIFEPGEFPVQQAMDEQHLGFSPNPHDAPAPDEWLRRLGALPLMHQPGERWLYNAGSDVLGVLIARASGMSLGDFLQERIFAPLGMTDTGFNVPENKLDRLASGYMTDPESGTLGLYDGDSDSVWVTPPTFHSGGAGLVSTVEDLHAFGQMLLRKGDAAGGRILSRPSVELMMSDQLTAEQKAISGWGDTYWTSHGWGFGGSVVTRRDDISETAGKYGWDGGLGTSWYVDPAEEMITILLTQASFTSAIVPPVVRDFWTSAYQVIAD